MAIFISSKPESECSTRDREIGNCVPAGKCHPDPNTNAVMDCDIKNYDSKLNKDI